MMDILSFKPISRYLNKEEKAFLANLGYKWCPKCKTPKSITDFHRSNEKYLASGCKDCILKQNRFYHDKYSEKKKIKVTLEDLPNFKIRGKTISSYEKMALQKLGFKWCPVCKKALRIEDFSKSRGLPSNGCKKCGNKRNKDYRNRHPNIHRRYRKDPEYFKKYRSTEEYRLRYVEWCRENRRKNPLVNLRTRLGIAIRRLAKNKGNSHTLEIVGVSSMEDFLNRMSLKTDNPNWLSDKYELDHIWQNHWFSNFLNSNLSDNEKILKALKVINSHRNLRPLPKEQNYRRYKDDFSPLLKEDLPLYEPYLNEDIKTKIKTHFGVD